MSTPLSHHLHIKNNLLAALFSHEYQHLLTHLERVELALGEVVYRADTEMHYVYFPENCVVSLLATLESGATTEVGLIGREGMIGLGIFLGGTIAHDLALVQVPGTAMRMKSSVLSEELRLGSPLQLLLLRYTRAFLALVTQSVVCSQHHPMDQRFARLLLMMHDYAGTGELRLTQEHIAGMLGSRRAGVTAVAGKLREAGLIEYKRGHITILDYEGLRESACECYGVVKEEFDRLYASQVDDRRLA